MGRLTARDRVDKGAKAIAVAQDLGQQRVEALLAAALKHRREGFGKRRRAGAHRAGQKLAPRRAKQRHFHEGLQHFEMRGDVGFERKLMQHRFAEGVDGLDLQSAGRLKGAGKKPAGKADFLAVGPATLHFLDLLRK